LYYSVYLLSKLDLLTSKKIVHYSLNFVDLVELKHLIFNQDFPFIIIADPN